MINPRPVLPEEPTAVTPHGGFCGGKSQQWLRYPTKPHVRFCAGALSNGRPYRNRCLATAGNLGVFSGASRTA